MARVGIVAAIFREVHPLVRNMETLKYLPDRRVQMYQNKNAVIAYAGMGHEAAFAAAPVKVDFTYDTPAEHHNAIELFSTTCVWVNDELTVNDPSQFVYGWKNGIAKELGIDPAKVRVVAPYVGGAFGSKGPLTPRTAIVALAAKKLNRPIRCVVTRGQGFTGLQLHHLLDGRTRSQKPHRQRTAADDQHADRGQRPGAVAIATLPHVGRTLGDQNFLPARDEKPRDLGLQILAQLLQRRVALRPFFAKAAQHQCRQAPVNARLGTALFGRQLSPLDSFRWRRSRSRTERHRHQRDLHRLAHSRGLFRSLD